MKSDQSSSWHKAAVCTMPEVDSNTLSRDSLLLILRRVTQLAYPYRGMARLAEKIRLHYLSVDKTYLVTDFDRSSKFFCALNEHIGSQIFWRGAYSGDQLKVLHRILRPDMTFVDVGANQGEFSVFAARRLSSGHTVSLEPVSFLFERLCRNIQANGFHNVTALQRGLSDREDRLSIYMRADRFVDGSFHEGLPSTVRYVDQMNEIEQINVLPLDCLVDELKLRRLDVMKIDVEGAEMRVLLGGINSIRRFRPIIFLEVCDESSRAGGYSGQELVEYVKSIGYRVERVDRGGVCNPLNATISGFQNVACWP